MKSTIIYSKDLKSYDFGEGHPFRSDRFEKFLELYEQRLGSNKDFELIENNSLATDEELELWHKREYIEAIKAASEGKKVNNLYRFISGDNVNSITGEFPRGIEKGARAVVKNSIMAIDYIQQEKTERAVSIGGGLHHAMPGYGEGFCVYNDVVIAVRRAIKRYNLKRVLVLDIDAHAGNGTCRAFYSDPQVLFIDLHQWGIYPLTGTISEIGQGKGKGYTVNLPLVAGTGDRSYNYIFDEIIFPLAKEFKPQLIVRYGGSDPYFADSLTGLGLTLDGFEMIREKVRQLSNILCGRRSVDLICSGYDPTILAKVWLVMIVDSSELGFDTEEGCPVTGNSKIEETKEMVKKVKDILKPYWSL